MRISKPWLASVLGCAFILGACQGEKALGPSRVISLGVAVPPTGEVRSSLLGTTSNEILYRVEGPGMDPLHGTLGPFSSSVSAGAINFTLDIPNGGTRILSLQLNDAASHQPLAIGAAGLDLTGTGSSLDLVVEMGSVTRNCYTLKDPGSEFGGQAYSFLTDSLAMTFSSAVSLYDVRYNYSAGSSTPLTLTGAPGTGVTLSTIAYLGNGNFVDFDKVPPTSSFNPTSALAKGAPVSIGDIFCLDLVTIPGAHAWFQVTGLGNGTLYQGPQYRYRVNATKNFFAFDQTPLDIALNCSATN